MRLFFGLELDQDTALRVADWRDRQFSHAGRPVPLANLHVTLAFIGELPVSGLEGLCLGVDQCLEQSPLAGASVALDQTGYWHKPGIYWLGATSWPEPLSRLAKKLRDLSSRVGGKRDKRAFQPHITLFRRCSRAPPAPAVAPGIRLDYQHFALIESRPGKHGVSYHPLQYWNLSAPS